MKIIVHDDLPPIDHPHSSGPFFKTSEKIIPLHAITISVPQSQRAGTPDKSIRSINIFARFVRNDLPFAITFKEYIPLYQRTRIPVGRRAVADLQGLAAVSSERRPR